jgi:hypothetical protein
MPEGNEERLLRKCRELIENKLVWGASATWTNQDFEILRDKIEGETGVTLSVATLKRIWGKVNYSSKPTVTTLDTLVQFTGYENWRTFRMTFAISNPEDSTDKVQISDDRNRHKPMERSKRKTLRLVLACAFLAISLSFFLFTKSSPDDAAADSSTYQLTSKRLLSSDLPNSVIFEYDAGSATEEDTVYIQQSWDVKLRTRVSADENYHTSIYYHPGFFQAKLVVNNNIVREHDVFIPTSGWLPLIEQESVPVYLDRSIASDSGALSISIKTITDNNVPLQPQPPWVAFHNVRTFGNLRSDNFIFETALRNDFSEGAGICQLTEIHIRFVGGLIMIPLSVPGCVAKLGMYDADGKKPDPSVLGCNLSDWVRVRCEVRDRKGILFIDGVKVYDLNFDLKPGNIIGLLYRFQGTGSVDYVTLSDPGGNVVFEDTF